MPVYKICTLLNVVQCQADTKIVWDGGVFHIRTGQYLGRCEFDGALVVVDDLKGKELVPDTEASLRIQAELKKALETGYY